MQTLSKNKLLIRQSVFQSLMHYIRKKFCSSLRNEFCRILKSNKKGSPHKLPKKFGISKSAWVEKMYKKFYLKLQWKAEAIYL